MEDRQVKEKMTSASETKTVLQSVNLFAFHRDEGVAQLLGPRAHHLRNWLLTGLLQMGPQIIYHVYDVLIIHSYFKRSTACTHHRHAGDICTCIQNAH